MIQLKVKLVSEPLKCMLSDIYKNTFIDEEEAQGYCFITSNTNPNESLNNAEVGDLLDIDSITNTSALVSISAESGLSVIRDGESFITHTHCWYLSSNYYFKLIEIMEVK